MNPTSETDQPPANSANSNGGKPNIHRWAEFKTAAGKSECNMAHQETPTTNPSTPSISSSKKSRASQILRFAANRRTCQSHNHKKSVTMGTQIQTQMSNFIEEHDLLRKCHEAMTNDYAQLEQNYRETSEELTGLRTCYASQTELAAKLEEDFRLVQQSESHYLAKANDAESQQQKTRSKLQVTKAELGIVTGKVCTAEKEIASLGRTTMIISEQRDFEMQKNKKSECEHLTMVGNYESKVCSIEKDMGAYIDRINALNRIITDMRLVGQEQDRLGPILMTEQVEHHVQVIETCCDRRVYDSNCSNY